MARNQRFPHVALKSPTTSSGTRLARLEQLVDLLQLDVPVRFQPGLTGAVVCTTHSGMVRPGSRSVVRTRNGQLTEAVLGPTGTHRWPTGDRTVGPQRS